MIIEYKYRLKPTGGGSNIYGDCQVCNLPVKETMQQIEEKGAGEEWEHLGSTFGHEVCLLGIRKAPYELPVRKFTKRVIPYNPDLDFTVNETPAE